MYLTDQRHSKGHSFVVTKTIFHPNENHLFFSSSLDGTIWVWDLNIRPFGIERQLPSLTSMSLKNTQWVGFENLLISKDGLVIGFSEKGDIACFDAKNQYKKPLLNLKF